MILFSLIKLKENIIKMLMKKYNNIYIYMSNIYCVKCKKKTQRKMKK